VALVQSISVNVHPRQLLRRCRTKACYRSCDWADSSLSLRHQSQPTGSILKYGGTERSCENEACRSHSCEIRSPVLAPSQRLHQVGLFEFNLSMAQEEDVIRSQSPVVNTNPVVHEIM
jgi:hypothetical protein